MQNEKYSAEISTKNVKMHFCTAGSARFQQLPRIIRRIHVPIDSRDMDSVFLSCSDLLLNHALKSIDSRFQSLRCK